MKGMSITKPKNEVKKEEPGSSNDGKRKSDLREDDGMAAFAMDDAEQPETASVPEEKRPSTSVKETKEAPASPRENRVTQLNRMEKWEDPNHSLSSSSLHQLEHAELEHAVQTFIAVDELHLIDADGNASLDLNKRTSEFLRPDSLDRWSSLSEIYVASDDDDFSSDDEDNCPVCLGILRLDQHRQLRCVKQLLCHEHSPDKSLPAYVRTSGSKPKKRKSGLMRKSFEVEPENKS
jgi:hypothetical protein